MPAYARDLIARRNRGDHPTDCFISVGWPSQWLRTHVATSPLTRGAAIVASITPGQYDWSGLRGLSCCVWIERDEDEARANEIAASVMAHSPSRCFVVNAVTGAQTWYCAAEELKVAA
jgi:hypothetical protein